MYISSPFCRQELWLRFSYSFRLRGKEKFFYSFTKYETVQNRSLFCRVSIVSRNCKKYEKSVSSFAKLKKMFRFVVLHNFLSILNAFFDFRTFWSSFVCFVRVSYLLLNFLTFFFEFHTFLKRQCDSVTRFLAKHFFSWFEPTCASYINRQQRFCSKIHCCRDIQILSLKKFDSPRKWILQKNPSSLFINSPRGIQESRDSGQKGFRTGGKQKKKDTGREGFETGEIQEKRDTGKLYSYI